MTAEQTMCMEAHHRVYLQKMGRLKAIIAIISLVGLGVCARDLTKCVVCKETLTLSEKRSRPAVLT